MQNFKFNFPFIAFVYAFEFVYGVHSIFDCTSINLPIYNQVMDMWFQQFKIVILTYYLNYDIMINTKILTHYMLNLIKII